MIEYSIGESVRAFTAGREDVLPFEVTQAHQVHGYKTAIIDRFGMTREELEGYFDDIYVARFSEPAVPDEFIRNNGEQPFIEMLREVVPWWEYVREVKSKKY